MADSGAIPRADQRIEVPSEDAGRALGDWLAEQLDAQDARDLIERGGVWADRRRVQDPAFSLVAGITIVVHRPPSGAYSSLTIDESAILFEDDDLIAINKPAGAYVEATPWDAMTHLRGALAQLLTERDGHKPILHPAHRLDRDTTGVLLFSKQPAVNRALLDAFAGHIALKHYLALCHGTPAMPEFFVETGHGRSLHGRFRVYPLDRIGQLLPDGHVVKYMATRFRVVETHAATSLLHAAPITGRTHQIRLHLAHAGYPIVGDRTYGPASVQSEPIHAHRLHAASLSLPHPRGHSTLTISAPEPAWVARAP